MSDSPVDHFPATSLLSKSFREEDKELNASENREKQFYVIKDNFETIHDVTKAMKEAGLNECGLIFGIDYTKRNRKQGQNTFDGRSLHDTSGPKKNPYQEDRDDFDWYDHMHFCEFRSIKASEFNVLLGYGFCCVTDYPVPMYLVIVILGETLDALLDEGKIPVFGFSDTLFPLKPEGFCKGFSQVLDVYNKVTQTVKLTGKSNYVQVIEEAVKIVQDTKKYHILVIIADGQIEDKKLTEEAIVEASKWPLSIVLVGVGDGPWEAMKDFDDGLTERKFDNFQFVNFHETVTGAKNRYAVLALRALMEIPEQYQIIKDRELLLK